MGYDNREDKRMADYKQVGQCERELELNPNYKPGAQGQPAPTGKTFSKSKAKK